MLSENEAIAKLQKLSDIKKLSELQKKINPNSLQQEWNELLNQLGKFYNQYQMTADKLISLIDNGQDGVKLEINKHTINSFAFANANMLGSTIIFALYQYAAQGENHSILAECEVLVSSGEIHRKNNELKKAVDCFVVALNKLSLLPPQNETQAKKIEEITPQCIKLLNNNNINSNNNESKKDDLIKDTKREVASLYRSNQPKSSIIISYRDEGNGKGAFYDHYTVQYATGYPTEIFISPQMDTNAFKSYIKSATYNLPFGIKNDDGKIFPNTVNENSNTGLLVIPGCARVTKQTEKKRLEVHKKRTQYEHKIIRDAINRGRPILALCAGSWQLWNVFYNFPNTKSENYIDGTTEVEGHVNGQMIGISKINGKVTYNVPVHFINIQPNSILFGSMSYSAYFKSPQSKAKGVRWQFTTPNNVTTSVKVNSVHWKAPIQNIPVPLNDKEHIAPSQIFIINAISVQSTQPVNLSRAGSVYPEANSIEGFETKHGVPVLGIQWHPEAYLIDKQQKNFYGDRLLCQQQTNILTYMAKAGDAYQAKQKMLVEFKRQKYPFSELLKKESVFGDQSNKKSDKKAPVQNNYPKPK